MKMISITFKIKLLIAYVVSLFVYTLIYYFCGKSHFTNINNDWFVECLYFASNMSSATGSTTLVPITSTIKLIITSHQLFCAALLGMLIIN
jgi:ABC-type multidrug transport system permease subunit